MLLILDLIVDGLAVSHPAICVLFSSRSPGLKPRAPFSSALSSKTRIAFTDYFHFEVQQYPKGGAPFGLDIG
jgi:hypothetical protein